MNSLQAFLLEVIVDRLDLREQAKGPSKLIGFSTMSKTQIMSDSAVMNFGSNKSIQDPLTATTSSGRTDGDRKRKQQNVPPCSISISFCDFDPIVLYEELDNSNREPKDTRDQQKSKEAEEAAMREELEQARAAGLSPNEYRDTKKKNPRLTEKRFTRGKSCLMRMRPTAMINLLRSEKLVMSVEGGWTYSMNLGSATIGFPPNFMDAVVTAAYSTAMREMIAREGHIWWPSHLYRTVMLKEVRQAQQMLQRRKEMELTQEDIDLSIRFKNLCDLPALSKPSSICDEDDYSGCPKPLTYDDVAPKKKSKSKKRKVKIDKKGAAWLMYPSPEPIKPPPLPTTAQTTEVVDIVQDDTKRPTAIVSLFIRLSCFGNSLELERTEDPFPD